MDSVRATDNGETTNCYDATMRLEYYLFEYAEYAALSNNVHGSSFIYMVYRFDGAQRNYIKQRR